MEAITKNSLKGARNIGPTIANHLNEIGVYTLADLAEIGPVQAYKQIVEQNPGKSFPVCYYLYSLQGALLDMYWDDLPSKMKKELRKQVGRYS